MIKYEDFSLSEMDEDLVMKRHQRLAVMDYIKKNGEEPSDIQPYYTATEHELELYKRAKYALLIQNSPQPQQIPDNEIWYTSTDGEAISKFSSLGTLVEDVVDGDHRVARYENDVTSIGDSAFLACRSLTSITLPSSVTSIGEYAFLDCRSLTSITLPSSVTSIGKNAFNYCTSLTSITLPNTLTSIGGDAFSDCESLTSITLPDSVTSIGSAIFQNCTSLASISISSSVTSIGIYTFQNCYSLSSITIPDSVTSIENYAFEHCDSLTSITSLNTTPPTISSSTLPKTSVVQHIYVPSSSVDAYKSAGGWLSYADRIEAISE